LRSRTQPQTLVRLGNELVWALNPPFGRQSGCGVACCRPMEKRKSTADLLNAWRDATRAAELADSLALHASDLSAHTDDTAVAAEQIAKLAERAAKAAERAAMTARDAAMRAAELARSSRDKNVSGAGRATAARAAEDVARDAYHAHIAGLADHPEDN
jgi:multidrug efflux pump subunit AcrA (membrane-fusion protein)